MNATIDMPGSTHELALSADGRTAYGTVYGDGVFARRVNPDRRIVVIDLPSKSLTRVIDLGAIYAPHGVMMDAHGTLWCSGELGGAVLAIDPQTDRVHKIDVGDTAHWVAISHATGKVFASVKSNYVVAIDRARRTVVDRIGLPHVVEGLAIAPDGQMLYVCAQDAAEFCLAFDPAQRADRGSQRRKETDAPRAGVAGQQICRGVLKSGRPRFHLRGRHPGAGGIISDQEVSDGLRLRIRRHARLHLLP
jgi:sugar lactone lactonase YvrE